MINKKAIKITIVFFILCLTSILLYQFFWTSKIIITIENEYDIANTTVAINGSKTSLELLEESQKYTYTLGVNPGKHVISVTSYGFEYLESEIETKPRESKNISVNLQKKVGLDPDTIAKSLIDTSGNKVVANSRFFEDNTWLVFTTSELDNNGSIVVAKINSATNSWEIIDAGTDIDLGSTELLGAPKILREYLSNL